MENSDITENRDYTENASYNKNRDYTENEFPNESSDHAESMTAEENSTYPESAAAGNNTFSDSISAGNNSFSDSAAAGSSYYRNTDSMSYTFRAEEDYKEELRQRSLNSRNGMEESPESNSENRSWFSSGEPFEGNTTFHSQNTYGNAPFTSRNPGGNPGFNSQSPCENPAFNSQSPCENPAFNSQNAYGDAPFRSRNAYGDAPFRSRNVYGDPAFGSQNAYGNPNTQAREPYENSNTPRIPEFLLQRKTLSSEDYKSQRKKQHVKKFFKKLGTAAACGILFGALAGGAFFGTRALYYYFNPEATAVGNEKNSENGNTLILDPVVDSTMKVETTQVSTDVSITSTDVSAVVDATMPSVVTISGTFAVNSWFGYYESEGSGSGIIVGENENELLIATNNHVVADSLSLKATLTDGTSYDASIKGTDPVADLAVIAIKRTDIPEETYSAIRIATLGDSDSVKVGQMAIAIGNALGYGQSTTVGYISAVEREVSVDGQTMVLLQTDAAINPGNSGGALLNINGEVIGINSVKYASSEVEGMGFAIPISRAMVILDDLMTREELAEDEKGYLGVYITDVTADLASGYNWPIGVYVSEVIEGSAAEKAGIYTGDIITAINQTTVTTSDALKQKVNSYRVGTVIDVTLQRLISGVYQEFTVQVTLGGASK